MSGDLAVWESKVYFFGCMGYLFLLDIYLFRYIRRSLQWLRPNTFEVFYADERFHCMANMYTNLSPTEQQNSIIITGTNQDRIALNRLTVEALPERDAPVKTIEVDTAKYNYLDHFYATTTWKVEGDSYLYSLINIDTWQNRINCREDFYVKISRAQKNLFIFTDDRSYLFAAVSGSSFERSLPPHQVQRNRFCLLSRQVQTHLLKASQHYLHYDALREGGNHCPHFQVQPDTPSAQGHHYYLTDRFTRSPLFFPFHFCSSFPCRYIRHFLFLL